ncbi:MAG TPA: hypothetical protein VLS89_19870, partial [Candidatus Nanopelagicales bacterium]|nr:hypothetical protein [Candidatus Nanopelagicales bacterium]
MTMHERVDFLDSRSERELPARPGLTLARTPGHEGGLVEFRVQIPPGLVAPARYRLRRAGGDPGAAEPLRIVAEGELPHDAAGTEVLVR